MRVKTTATMDYKQACVFAKDVSKYYMKLMPVKNNHLYNRTCSLFIHIIFDEIELYFVNRMQSSLRVSTEYGISQFVSNLYTDFIRPMYFSLFLHDKLFDDNKSKIVTCVSKSRKRVHINISRNRVHFISK